MQTSTVRCNGVRDSTEQKTVDNWAAEYAKRLVEDEAAAREAADKKSGEQIANHVKETATDKKSSHVFLSDAVDSDLNAATGKTAATPKAVKIVNDDLNTERSERKTQYENLDKRLKQEVSDRIAGDNAAKKYVDDKSTALGKRIDEEATARQSADTALGERIDAEITDRGVADDALRSLINGEITDRKTADTQLGGRIDNESTERKAADSALDVRLKAVEQKAHTHENKEILDGIDAERVAKWDEGSEGEITRAEYLEHLAETERQFEILWGLFGMSVYDGGWFGVEQNDAPLDGGLFEDEELSPLDCGGFEPYAVPSGSIGEVVDGGVY